MMKYRSSDSNDIIVSMMKYLNVEQEKHCERDSDICMECCPNYGTRSECWKYLPLYPEFTDKKEALIYKALWELSDEQSYYLDKCIEKSETIKEAIALFIVCHLPEHHKLKDVIKEILERKNI